LVVKIAVITLQLLIKLYGNNFSAVESVVFMATMCLQSYDLGSTPTLVTHVVVSLVKTLYNDLCLVASKSSSGSKSKK